MSDGLKFNSETENWLEKQGCIVTPEDKLGLEEGEQKPDFLCEKDGVSFWVEVKSIDIPEWFQDQIQYYDKFKSNEKKVKKPGKAFIKIADKITEKQIKVILQMIDNVLSLPSFPLNKGENHYVIIPKNPLPAYNEFINIEYETSRGKEILYSVKSKLGKYSRNGLGRELLLNTKIKFTDSNQSKSEGDLFGFGTSLGLFDDSNFLISVELLKGESEFRICSIGPAFAEESANKKTTRNSSKKARVQFKSANEKLGEKPSVVIFHQDNIFAVTEERFISAFYGDLTFEWSGGESMNKSFFYGKNGFWNPNKNTTVSAAIYFRKNEKPILVHNYWAKLRFPSDMLICKELIPENNGTFKVKE